MVERANQTTQTTGIRYVSTLEVPTMNRKQKESRDESLLEKVPMHDERER
jgi:hypothetical protein